MTKPHNRYCKRAVLFLTMRTPMGFLLPMNNQNNTFEKPPLSIEAQLERLSSRGLIIQDQRAARHYLTFISYYRFSGYAIKFERQWSQVAP
jgi:hypothetical protein